MKVLIVKNMMIILKNVSNVKQILNYMKIRNVVRKILFCLIINVNKLFRIVKNMNLIHQI